MVDVAREVAQAIRGFLRNRAFSAIALLTLSLGIGASTGIYSVVDATLLRPLQFPDADRIAFVWGVAGPERDIRGASHPEIMDWRGATPAFTMLSIYEATELTMGAGSGNAERVPGETVSASYFDLIGVRPALGRLLQPSDELPGAAAVVVIAYDLWQRRFGGAADVIGTSLRLGTQTFDIVGVLPEHARGLSMNAQLWTTLSPLLTPEALARRGDRWLAAVGRLAAGATPELAQQQLDIAARTLEETYPETNRERGAQLVALREQYVGTTRGMLLILLGAVGLLLVLACAHVANLLLVRGTARTGELALRYALGATRGRVLRQLLIESTTLALASGVVALILAYWGLLLLLPLVPAGVLPAYANVRLSLSVIMTGLALSLLTGLVVGLVPAVRATRDDIRTRLAHSSRSTATGMRHWGAQHAFVAGSVAVALVLLIGGALLIRSFQQQIAIDTGFTAEGVTAARFSLASAAYPPEQRVGVLAKIEEVLRSNSAVDDVAFTSDAPLRNQSSAFIVGSRERPDVAMRVYRHQVSANYFDALGIRLLRGRSFDATDNAAAPLVAIVSDAMAHRMWPAQDPVGRTLMFGERQAQVIGVVENVRQRTLTTDLMDPGEDPDVYFHYVQLPAGAVDLLVTSTAPASVVTTAVREALLSVNPDLAVAQVEPLALALRRQTAAGRFGSSLLTVFAACALILALTGIYGILSFMVGARRREIALRMALGATPSSVRRLVLRQGGAVVAAGVVVGLGIALPGVRLLTAYLYGVAPTDARTLTLAVALVSLTALAASWIPARRATRLDPQLAFRSE